MNPVPFLLRGFAKWQRIKTEVDNWAQEWESPTYTEAPTLYRFSGWGFDLSKGIALQGGPWKVILTKVDPDTGLESDE